MKRSMRKDKEMLATYKLVEKLEVAQIEAERLVKKAEIESHAEKPRLEKTLKKISEALEELKRW